MGAKPMKLYSGPLSLFGRKAEIALAEKGLTFERVVVPFNQMVGYNPKHPDVLAANPKGQVPVLVDGELTLYDSTLILEYLDEAYPRPPLYPATPVERARCRQHELFADEVVFDALRRLFHRNGERLPLAALEQAEDEARTAETLLARYFVEIEAALAQKPYLCGAFSVADIGMVLMVHYVRRLDGPSFAALPALTAWYERVAARPVFAAQLAEIADWDRKLSLPLQRL
jgi:glutathione S-transferase